MKFARQMARYSLLTFLLAVVQHSYCFAAQVRIDASTEGEFYRWGSHTSETVDLDFTIRLNDDTTKSDRSASASGTVDYFFDDPTYGMAVSSPMGDVASNGIAMFLTNNAFTDIFYLRPDNYDGYELFSSSTRGDVTYSIILIIIMDKHYFSDAFIPTSVVPENHRLRTVFAIDRINADGTLDYILAEDVSLTVKTVPLPPAHLLAFSSLVVLFAFTYVPGAPVVRPRQRHKK